MQILDQLYSVGKIRKALWRHWYGFLTRRVRGEEVLFLNYAFEEEPPRSLALAAEDEPNRSCIQLYQHVAEQVDLRGKTVVEVSCGHGGGASYLVRTMQPRRYIGLDLNTAGIAFCRKRHPLPTLEFIAGDAEALPFADGSVDAVLNIEASHCYADFPRFLSEAARILRPGGDLLYADFRFPEGLAAWDEAIAAAPLSLRQWRDIGPEVLRGMARNSARSQALIVRHLPRLLHGVAADFAGIEGSRIYQALRTGELTYRSYDLRKDAERPARLRG